MQEELMVLPPISKCAIRRGSGGNTDFRAVCIGRDVFRRAHKGPRGFLYVPGEGSLPAEVELEGLLTERRTVVALQSGLEHETVD